jgi:hypothetical protein
MTDWLVTLEVLQRHLDLQAGLIEQGRYDEVLAFTPPADLPTLPPGLVTRASELLSSAQALTDRAVGMRDDTGKLLSQPYRLPLIRRPHSAYVDQRA